MPYSTGLWWQMKQERAAKRAGSSSCPLQLPTCQCKSRTHFVCLALGAKGCCSPGLSVWRQHGTAPPPSPRRRRRVHQMSATPGRVRSLWQRCRKYKRGPQRGSLAGAAVWRGCAGGCFCTTSDFICLGSKTMAGGEYLLCSVSSAQPPAPLAWDEAEHLKALTILPSSFSPLRETQNSLLQAQKSQITSAHSKRNQPKPSSGDLKRLLSPRAKSSARAPGTSPSVLLIKHGRR